MLEQYVLNELEKLKDENQRLRNQISSLNGAMMLYLNESAVNVELINKELIFEKLNSIGVDICDICDRMSSAEIAQLIIDNNLYKEMKEKSDFVGVVKYNNRYFKIEKSYRGIEMEEECYISLYDAVYNELTDNLYDMASDYKRNLPKEEEEDAGTSTN